MDLFDLVAKITLDSSEYEKGINDSKKSADDLGNALDGTGSKSTGWGSRIGKAAKIGATAIAAVSAATVVFGTVLTKSVNNVADYGDKVDKMSQKIGISSDAYQKWDYVMKRAGGNVDSLKMGMKTLSQQAEKNSDSFQKLGISQEEVAKLSQEELFEKTVKGLADMEAGTERTVLATQLLGRAGADLGPLLNQGSGAIEEQMKIAEKYGMVMPESAVKASAAFKDSVTTMQMTMTGLKNRMIGEFLPAFTKVADGLSLIFSGDMSGIEDVEKGIDGIINKLSDGASSALEIGGKIIESIAFSIVENLPKLTSSAVGIIMKLVKSITGNLPMIVKSAASMIVALTQGIAKSLPTLIPTMVEAVITMTTTLLENIDLLIDAATALINGLTEGLIAAIPILIKNAPKIIKALVYALVKGAGSLVSAGISLMANFAKGIVKGFASIPNKVVSLAKKIPQYIKNGVGSLVGIGTNIIDGLWKGIKARFDVTINKVKELASKLPKAVKKVLGIASPSKVFMELGKWIPEGLALGIEKNMKAVYDASDAMTDATSISPSISSTARSAGVSGNIIINLNYSNNEDANQLARDIAVGINRYRMAGAI